MYVCTIGRRPYSTLINYYIYNVNVMVSHSERHPSASTPISAKDKEIIKENPITEGTVLELQLQLAVQVGIYNLYKHSCTKLLVSP